MRGWLLGAALLAVSGCEAQPCVRQSDCRSGLVCQVGICTVPPTDAGPDAGDASFDAPELRDVPSADVLDAPPTDGGDAPPGADAGPVDAGPDAPADLDAAADLDAPDAVVIDAP